MTERDIFLIEVARRGRDGNYAGATAVAALDTRTTALEARPNITSLNAVPNVTAPTPASGQVLSWDGTAWVPAGVQSGLATVRDATGTTVGTNITTLYVQEGVTAEPHGSNPSIVYIKAVLDGTGTRLAAARTDHTHTNPAPTRATFAPQAYMSSGTRSLASTNVVLPDGISCVVKARLNMQMRGADPGPCYYQLRITIAGNSRTSGAGTDGFWAVQGVPDKPTWEHDRTISGTGAATTVSADVIYHSGGGFYTDAGELVVEISAAR